MNPMTKAEYDARDEVKFEATVRPAAEKLATQYLEGKLILGDLIIELALLYQDSK
jgi:hypothetical protein